MENHLVQIFFDEAGQLELLVSDLYTLLGKLLIEDSLFWHQLADEEKSHAELIKTIKNSPVFSKEYVSDSAPDLLQEILQTKELVSTLILKYSEISLTEELPLIQQLPLKNQQGKLPTKAL